MTTSIEGSPGHHGAWEGSLPGFDRLWSVVRRQRLLSIGLPVAGAVLLAAATLVSARKYEARAAFMAQQTQSPQAGLGALASQFGLVIPGGGGQLAPQFYADLLQSAPVLNTVLLHRYPLEDGSETDLLTVLGVEGGDTARALAKGRRLLRKDTRVHADRVTSVVALNVRMPTPVLAVAVVHRFLEELNRYNLERRQSVGRSERIFLEQRTRQAGDSLRQAEDELARFLRSNRETSASPSLMAEEQRLRRVVNRWEEVYGTLTQNYEVARLQEVRDTPAISVVEAPDVRLEPQSRGVAFRGLLGAILGVVLGIPLAVWRERRSLDAEQVGAGSA